MLHDLKGLEGSNTVQLPAGEKAEIMNTRISTILGDMNLIKVLFVPEFKFNLLSVTRLTKDLSCNNSFFPNFCTLQDLYSGKVIGIGREHNSLYLLKDEVPAVVSTTIKADNHTDLWHITLGHPSLKVMQHILSLKDHIDVKRHNNCQTYPLAKQCRIVFPESHSSSTKCFQLMHVDVLGPYKTPTYEKKQYYVTIVDDFNRFTWICFIQCKTEVISIHNLVSKYKILHQIMVQSFLISNVVIFCLLLVLCTKVHVLTPHNKMG